jgi:hypothetical protein
MAKITGGGKLEAYLKEISANVSKAATLQVGFLEGSTAPDGQSIPLRAAMNEFGTSKAPPRPYFRNMIAAKSPSWPAAVGARLKANDFDAEKTLQQTGEGIAGQLKQSIRDLVSPPLAESTIKRKGFDKPLIEHGDMLNAVDYDVKS